MTRTDYLRREDRRRLASSLAVALAAYVVVGLGVFLLGLLHVSDLSELPSPVWVDIGTSSDTAPGQPLGGDVPAPKAAAVSAPPPSAPAPAPVAKEATSSPTLAPTPGGPPPSTGGAASTSPQAEPASAQPSLPAEGAEGATGEAWVPGPRPAGSRVISTTSGVGTSGAGQTTPGGAFVTKVVGNEKGNSLETVLGVGAGKSGRSLYVPIYLYMPLPKKVSDNVALRVSPIRRDLFLRTYKRINEEWVLSREVPVADRDELWLALEEGGYDVAHADYKASGNLQPVTLSFVVTPSSPGSPPSLEAVSLTSSSGDPAVDEAVLYGFKRASFFNATDGTISGTFIYSFQK